MKIASTAALAILSGSRYLKADLYDITLLSGEAHHFTGLDIPVKAAIATGPSSFGASNTYLTGLTISRGRCEQTIGLEVQELELTVTPQQNNPAGPITFGGYSLQQAIGQGIFDGATIVWSNLFMNMPIGNAILDTSPGGIAFFSGTVGDCDPVGRFSAVFKVACGLQYLQTQMPRNLFQAGCVHTVYDTGCGLQKADNSYSGAVTSAASGWALETNLTQATNFFSLGIITFTSGVNNGLQQTVSAYSNTSGTLLLNFPFPNVPAPGDTFTIIPGCDRQQSTCSSGNFKVGSTSVSNLPHNKGLPFVPVVETLYDGESVNVNQPAVVTPATPVSSAPSSSIMPSSAISATTTGIAVTGAVTSVSSASAFHTNLTQANGYFNGGLIRFTSGANNGKSQYISTYLNASGAITLTAPMPITPSSGDTFSITP